MDAELKCIEIEMTIVGDHEFAVENAFLGKLLAHRFKHLGEVAVERLFIAALQENLIPIAKYEDAKAIPLGLVDPVPLGRDLFDAFGEHRKDWRIYGDVHALAPEMTITVWMR